MKNVKIIKGYYGAKIGVKGANDAPFALDDAEAARIVALGVAVYTGDPEAKETETEETETEETETKTKKIEPKGHTGTRRGKSK